MSPEEIEAAFEDVFDQAIVFHGFADFMRDYDVIVHATSDPRTGTSPENLRYRFRHCVRANITTAVPPEVWAASLDDRLTDYESGVDLDGYVWGVKWQVLYPGIKLEQDSREATEWSGRIQLPMHQAIIETNGHNVDLIFSALEVTTLPPGWSPFTVGHGGPDWKIPLP
ncbi:hypothetical protein FHE65_03065 [Mumia zhuanghuii]|uniref:YxiG-like domain-containing protein n=1 Tax=Mumia zhuanghuii TaxID=2585211 RepID=A0A5C4MW59_9ACTN|nr:hypothetical protein FHE65_08080 [Mumia zhuanghuii]TNC50993.1 hypothetical protein FHE65_03065 [Mumia zhuanghuii]